MEISATERNKAEKGTKDIDSKTIILNSVSWGGVKLEKTHVSRPGECTNQHETPGGLSFKQKWNCFQRVW